MATLTSRKIKDSYTELLKIKRAVGVNSTMDGESVVEDGDATSSALFISSAGIKSLGTLEVTGATTLTGAITATSQTLAIGAITSGLINGQTISSAANFTGTLGVTGATTLSGDVLLTSATSTKPELIIRNTNADATGGTLFIDKLSASPANNDELGRFYMRGYNSTPTLTEFILMRAITTNVTAASEASTLEFFTYKAGVQTSTLSLVSGNVTMAGTLGVTGNLTVDTNMLFVDAANDRVGIGTITPTLGKLQVSQASDVVTGGITITDAAVNDAGYFWIDGTNLRIDSSSNASGKIILNGSGTGNVGIGQPAPVNLLSIGNRADGVATGGTPTLNVAGYTISNGSLYYGNYGGIILQAANAYTSSARKYLITNAYGTNIFGIIRSVDSETLPTLGTAGAITSGTVDFYIDNTGAVTIPGSLSKGSGSFKIDHPLKPETHQLVHSFVEAPNADLIYRGKTTLTSGKAEINIDTIARMSEGTFEALNREVQCFTSNESGWSNVKGLVIGNLLKIECQDENSTDIISWLVIGERKDKHIMETDWTDENGKPIVEPLKTVEPLKVNNV